MCGICGIVNFNQEPVKTDSIHTMMQTMKHRGPDDEGSFFDDTIGLGFVRLSIIDLSPAGHQPMCSFDKRYVVVFNGEIYNYIEIKEELKNKGYKFNTNTDTEVLLNSFIEWGEDCLNHFNGMFSFIIYNQLNRSIFGARDRFGIKPFYYIINGEQFIFASEIPPLLSLYISKPTPDDQAIFDFLVFNRTDQSESTFFSEIKKLQHGHTIKISNNKVLIEKWYDLRDHVKKTDGFSDPAEYYSLFSDAIRLRLRSDVPVGVCLSGGLDSSSIVSILLQDYNKTDLSTFSAIYKEGQYGDESEFIAEYEPLLKDMHYIFPDAESLMADLTGFVKLHAEPIAGTGPYAQFKVMELASQHVVVTIDGQGADETLAGYYDFFGYYFKELFLHFRIGKLFNEVSFYLFKHRSAFGLISFLYFLLSPKLKMKARINEKGYISEEFIKKHNTKSIITSDFLCSKTLNEALLDHFEYKLEHLLKWEDRNSMWFSLEARVPFLDYRLVEKTLATSSDLIIKNGSTKYLLREAMKNIIPEKIRNRQDKIGFGTPQDEWFREGQWQILITGIINSDSFKSRDLIVPSKAINLYKQHLEGKINISKEIWKWIHLELWFREFID